MRRFVVMLPLAIAVGGLAGCGSGGGDGAVAPAVTTTVSTTQDLGTVGPVEPLDDSPFCIAARGLEALGREQAPADRSAAQVLAQNEKLAGLIEIVAANKPADAPDAMDELVDDYRVLAAAIAAANGDVEAAFEVLDAEDPQLSVRLGLPDSYHDAVVFFADRCGTALPGA
ncbi:MAG: hypothetical protein WD691_09410 [Acidimicrobiales bacterium]